MLSEDQIGITKDELIRTYELIYKWGQIQSYVAQHGYLSDSQLSYATKIESAARVHLKHGLEALIDAYTKWVEMFKNTPHDDEEWLKFEIRIVDTLEYMNSVSSDLGDQIAAFNRGISTAHTSGRMGEYIVKNYGAKTLLDDLSSGKYTAEWDRELNKVLGRTASVTNMIKRALLHLQARSVTPTLDDVESWRQDFLMLINNANTIDVDNKEQMNEFLDARSEFHTNLERYTQAILKALETNAELYERGVKYPDLLKSLPRLSRVWSQGKYFVDKSRPVWSFLHEIQYISPDDSLLSWSKRTKRKARAAWDWFKEVIEFTEGIVTYNADNPDNVFVVHLPEIENQSMHGFQVQLFGFEEEDATHNKYLDIASEALRLFKEKASRTVPWLVKNALPFRIGFIFERGGSEFYRSVAGRYNYRQIEIFPWAFSTNINETVRVFAHEMGHHMYSSMSGAAVDDFKSLVGTAEEWDIRELTQLHRADESESEFSDRVRQQYPEIYNKWMSVVERGKDLLFFKDIVEYLAAGGDPMFTLPSKIVTPYGTKNSEEAFCETVGMLVAYGPRTVDEEVRELFNKMKLEASTTDLDETAKNIIDKFGLDVKVNYITDESGVPSGEAGYQVISSWLGANEMIKQAIRVLSKTLFWVDDHGFLTTVVDDDTARYLVKYLHLRLDYDRSHMMSVYINNANDIEVSIGQGWPSKVTVFSDIAKCMVEELV